MANIIVGTNVTTNIAILMNKQMIFQSSIVCHIPYVYNIRSFFIFVFYFSFVNLLQDSEKVVFIIINIFMYFSLYTNQYQINTDVDHYRRPNHSKPIQIFCMQSVSFLMIRFDLIFLLLWKSLNSITFILVFDIRSNSSQSVVHSCFALATTFQLN